jgi:hypothetical protein
MDTGSLRKQFLINIWSFEGLGYTANETLS